MRITSFVRIDTIMFEPTASNTSILSIFLVSHGLAVNEYGLEVKAPTGHKSITFPDSSDRNIFSMYVPTCHAMKRILISFFCVYYAV